MLLFQDIFHTILYSNYIWFWFVIRLWIYDFGLRLWYHDRNYFKYHTGLKKTHLLQGLSEPELFYDLVYKFRKM